MAGALAILISGAAGGATSSASSPSTAALAPRVSAPEHCQDARKGLRWYRDKARFWRTRMGAAASPRRSHVENRCPQLHHAVRFWRAKARANRLRYERWSYQYEWRRWLPAKFYRVARCETDVDWHFDSGTYVSAFGIIRVAFPGWNGHNSPREQYEMAASIQRRYSWSAWGCGGA